MQTIEEITRNIVLLQVSQQTRFETLLSVVQHLYN